MSNDMNRTVREFYKAVEGVKNKKPLGYDTQATVRRIEDGVAWVHIPDGVDETPARMTISAKVGDVVQVRIVNGRAFLVGNASAPPTDNTEAVKAMGQAGLAAEAASIARQKADEAVEDAATAHEAAMLAKDSADAAQASADAAQTSADNAQASATTANQAANSALAGLGTVESVLDVVTWFSEHKTATTDTTVQAGKSYYEYDASTGVLTKVDPEGTENPSEEGWYELDEAITNYVSTHLAQTNDGLNVVSSINGWRVLISSGGGNYNAGVYLIDPNGNIAQSTTAAGVVFNTGKPVNIGDSTAYINFDGNGHITVVGADFTIGGANNQNGVLTVLDANGNAVGTWTKDGIGATAGTIGPFTITTDALYYGLLTIGTKENIIGESETSVRVTSSSSDTLSSVLTSKLVGIQKYAEYSPFEGDPLEKRFLSVATLEEMTDYTVTPNRHKGQLKLHNVQERTSKVGMNDKGVTLSVYEDQNKYLQVEGNLALYGTAVYPMLLLRGTTYNKDTYASDNNPRIDFHNSDESKNVALIFTDKVQAPASLTLAGNQGGEYFIAPNIKITGSLYNQYNNAFIRPNVDNWLRINDLGSYTSGTYFGTGRVRTDGYFQVGGENPNTQYRNGSIEFTGDVAKATAPSATQYKNIVFLDNGGRDSYHRLAFIEHYKTTANENVLQFGVYNHIAGTSSNSWPVGMRFTIDRNQNYFITFWGNMINTSVYNNTASNAANMFISSSGTFCRSTASSKRYKHDIKILTNYNDILNIPVVSYKYNTDYLSSFDKRYNIDIPGFIAEDIEKYYPIATEYNDNGEVEDWNVRIIIPPMLAVIKDLKGQVQELSAEINRMKKGMKAS